VKNPNRLARRNPELAIHASRLLADHTVDACLLCDELARRDVPHPIGLKLFEHRERQSTRTTTRALKTVRAFG
jgi:hypothetical protein